MHGRFALITERTTAGWFAPGHGYGRVGGDSRPAGRRVMTQSKSGKLDIKMTILVKDDDQALRKIIRKYLQKNGLKKSVPLADNLVPRAIFWLKK